MWLFEMGFGGTACCASFWEESDEPNTVRFTAVIHNVTEREAYEMCANIASGLGGPDGQNTGDNCGVDTRQDRPVASQDESPKRPGLRPVEY